MIRGVGLLFLLWDCVRLLVAKCFLNEVSHMGSVGSVLVLSHIEIVLKELNKRSLEVVELFVANSEEFCVAAVSNIEVIKQLVGHTDGCDAQPPDIPPRDQKVRLVVAHPV